MPVHLSSFFLAQRKWIVLFAVFTTIVSALALFRGYIYGSLVNTLVSAVADQTTQAFLLAMVVIIGTELVLFALRIPYDFIYSRCRGYMNIHARVFGVDRIITQQYQALAKMGSGKLLQIVHNGMEWYSFLIYDGIRNGLDIILSLTVLMISIWRGNIWFVWYFFLGAGLLYLFQRFAFARLSDVRLRERNLNESYTKQTAKILMNFLLLKLYGLKEKEIQLLISIWQARVDNYAYLKLWFNGVASAGNLLLILLMLGTTWYFGLQVIAWVASLSYMMTIFFLTNFARERFYGFGLFLAEFAEKLTYIQRYDEMTTQIWEETPTPPLITRRSHDIVMESISYQYEWWACVLDDFHITIPHGQKIAIMGKSGSGKSTLCKLMTKLIVPSSGQIFFINGEEKILADQMGVEELYRHVWYFYQEPLVFDGTIGENLSLQTDVDQARLLRALQLAQLDHLTLDTIVGEQGLLLSGWEKQRLGLARAFVFDYDVIILDEPSSNLDIELEKNLLTTLFAWYKEKTIICITHRPLVLEMVDRIVTMKSGLIISDEHKESQ